MIDAQLLFDGSIASTGVPSGTAITNSRASTNVIDLLVARDVGVDDALELHVDVTQAFTTTNSATLQISFQTSAQTNSGFVDLLLSPVIAASNLIIGAPIFRFALPINQANNATNGILGTPGRYLRLNYTVGTGVFTAGAVFAYINGREDRVQFWPYPGNYTTPTS